MPPADEKPTVADFDFDAREVGGQVIVFDHGRETLHVLDWATAYVWYLCDGEHTVDDMAKVLSEERRQRVGAKVVRRALDELETAQMIDRSPRPIAEGEGDAWRGRREFLLRAAVVAGASVVAPTILSIGGATPAAAASTVPLMDRLRNRLTGEVNPLATTAFPTTAFPTTAFPTTAFPTTGFPTTTTTGFPTTTTSTSTTQAPTTTSTSTTQSPTTSTSTTQQPTTSTSTTSSTAAPTSSTAAPTTTLGPALPPGVRESIEQIIDSLERFGDKFHDLIEELDDILRRFRPGPTSFLSR